MNLGYRDLFCSLLCITRLNLTKKYLQLAMRYLIVLALLVPIYSNLFAYDTSGFRVWSTFIYNDNLKSNPNWLYQLLLEGRFKDQRGLYYQGIIQSQVGYAISNRVSLWAGYALLPSTSVEGSQRTSVNVQRLYQQLEIDLVDNPYQEMNSRSRIEERRRSGYNQIGLLFRQRILWNTRWLMIKDKYTPFVSDEIFVNVNKPVWGNQKTFDQNRFMLGVTFPCGGERLCQVAYLNQYILGASLTELNHILHLSLIV